MEFSAFYLSVIAGTSLSAAFTYAIYKKVRPKYGIKVNCWFCNRNNFVPYGNQSCWDCPYCEQYNGFDKDGDYNKPIPAQHYEEMNHPITGGTFFRGDINKFNNDLCEDCNQNQILKVRQLAKFRPQHEATYEDELESFSKHLDKVYQLCVDCECTLRTKLKNQDLQLQGSLLDHQLNDSFDQETVLSRSILQSKMQSTVSLILRILAITIALLSFLHDVHYLQEDSGSVILQLEAMLPNILMQYFQKCNHEVVNTILPLIGLMCVVLAVFRSGKYRLQKSDGFTCISWVVQLAVHSHPSSTVIPAQDLHLFRPLLSVTVILMTVVSTLLRRYTLLRSVKKTLSKCARPSLAGTLRSLNGSADSSMWDDAMTSISQQTCFRCNSQISNDCSAMKATSVVRSKNPGEFKKLPKNFNAMTISPSEAYALTDQPSSKIQERWAKSRDKSSTCYQPFIRHRGRPLLRPAKLDMINQYDRTTSWTKSSWVDGGFWDSCSNSGQSSNPVANNDNRLLQKSFKVTEDRFSAFSEPAIPTQVSRNISNLGLLRMDKFDKISRRNYEKTSEYSSDNQSRF